MCIRDREQAEDRAGGKLGNKGDECAITAIKMIDLDVYKRQFSSRSKTALRALKGILSSVSICFNT